MQSGRPENRIQYYENTQFFINLGSRNGIFCSYQIWVETDKKKMVGRITIRRKCRWIQNTGGIGMQTVTHRFSKACAVRMRRRGR